MLATIDLTRKVSKPRLFLSKPNAEIIGIISEAYSIISPQKLGGINELTFSIPCKIDVHHELIDNPNIIKIKDRYLIKFVYGNQTEWFIINQITSTIKDDLDCKTIHAFSLGYELSDKIIRSFTRTVDTLQVWNARELLIGKEVGGILQEGILTGTIWNISPDFDAVFELMYREIDISEATVLDALIQIADTFGALIIYDTENRQINFQQIQNNGLNKGLHFSYGNLLKTAETISMSDEMCTRYKVFGKDGLSINLINLTGQDYFEDLGFFMNTDYMSQNLIDAIEAYEALLLTKVGTFETYVEDLESAQVVLTGLQVDMQTLEDEMTIIEDNLSLAQTNRQPENIVIYQQQKVVKQAEIDSKQIELDNAQATLDEIYANIANLRSEISIENNFSPELITERNLFIIEKTWSDENYIYAQDLYDAGLTNFAKIRIPQVTATIDVVNFLEILTEQRNWDKLTLGDYCYIYYEKLNIDITAKIIEIQFDFEAGTIQLTIANVKDIKNNANSFLESLNKSISTSTEVDMSKYRWDGITQTQTDVDQILNNAWNAALREINGGINETVQIDGRGITISDVADPLKGIRMTNSVIALSNDGFNTLGVAIDSTGVYAERLIGQIIAGENLTITTENGNFLVNETGIFIEDLDLIITKSDGYSKIIMNASDGILIQKNIGTLELPEWETNLTIDASGNITLTGIITATSGKIGNWDIINGYISGTKVGLISDGTADGLAIWAGETYTNRLDAPFRVYNDGTAYLTGVTIAGGSISWADVTPPNAEDVGAIPNTYIDENGVYTGKVAAVNITSLGHDPIIRLFQDLVVENGGDPGLDATLQDLQGIGNQIRLKWNDDNYFSVAENTMGFYFYYSELGTTSAICEVRPDGFYVGGTKIGGVDSGGVYENIFGRIWVETSIPITALDKDIWINPENFTRFDITEISTNTTLEISDNEVLYITGTTQITLHVATSAGIIKKIYNKGTGLVTMIGMIDGLTNMYLFPGESVELITDGSGWRSH